MKAEIFQNKKLKIEGPFTTPTIITKRSNLEITTKLVQITDPNAIKVNPRFQDVKEWRKLYSISYKGLMIHNDFYIQNKTGCTYSLSKSKYYQLDLNDEFEIEFRDERFSMAITQTVLVREFLAISFKINHDEWNYIGRCDTYEGFDPAYEVSRHQMNIRDGITKEELSNRINQTNVREINTK
jgi:hypothetical protein